MGLPWRHLNSVIAALPHKKSTLADVITIPADVFDLNNLKELVSLMGLGSHSYQIRREIIIISSSSFLEQLIQSKL
ncbi:hypothetical protein Dimus_004360 [Dionaea muscipula]